MHIEIHFEIQSCMSSGFNITFRNILVKTGGGGAFMIWRQADTKGTISGRFFLGL